MTGRSLGIDHGDVRTGVAVTDGLGLTAQPKEVVRERDMTRTAERVAEIARDLDAAEIVIGLPINMDGTEGPRAKKARKVGAKVEALVDVPVRYWDERLTSAQAERSLAGRGSRLRKAKVDVVSAQIMLQSYVDARKRLGADEEG